MSNVKIIQKSALKITAYKEINKPPKPEMPEAYLEPLQTFKMEFLEKKLMTLNHELFHKKLYYRCFQGI